MTNPTGTQATPTDYQKLAKMLSEELSEDTIVQEMQQMAATKRGKMTFGNKVDKASHRKHALTIRITPELHVRWMKVIDELSTATATTNPEIKKRASANFTTALQDGQLIIEVNENGKLQAFTSQETALKLHTGELELHGKNGSVKHYDNVSVIDKKGFQDLAKTIVSLLHHAPEPHATITSEEIAQPQNGTPVTTATTPPLPPKAPPQKKIASPAKADSKAPAAIKEEEIRKEDKLAEATNNTLQKEAEVIAKEDERKAAKIVQDTTKSEEKNASQKVEAENAELPDFMSEDVPDSSSGKTAG